MLCGVVFSVWLSAQPAPPRQAMFFSHFLPWSRHMMQSLSICPHCLCILAHK
uniref:Uncharacterized protein n=1 Tax=Arundo donax TaxID=35708 RepID=A0A0A9CZM1_ARUDO